MDRVILVLGGTKSGKSRYALERARALGGDRVTFVATAQPGDPELDVRISRHRSERPAAWRTVEPAIDLAPALRDAEPSHVVLLDSLTLWLSWAIEHSAAPQELWAAAQAEIERRAAPVVIVSEEVGLGLIPTSPLGRRFLDEIGVLNQAVAVRADEVWLLVAGIPVRLKSS